MRKGKRATQNEETYWRGYEDAVEMCLTELSAQTEIADAKAIFQMMLGSVKDAKFERLKQKLCIIGGN
ncbi:MAG: hypothetical protein LBH79_02530 [Nitrososphaerota archaeon]|jgi:hypothetical protein|nr:hypothetical protein [Nitrososphaerota archaeon]